MQIYLPKTPDTVKNIKLGIAEKRKNERID